MAASWEEVKRLAADFVRVQLSSTKQKLSERNVVEIVTKLIEQKLIEVIYTLDGKEYLTHQELVKEIKEELVVHGGRINLVELQQILNVDLSHIESKVSELLKHDKNLNFILGQLIDKTYLDAIAEEINEKLQEDGHITIGDLTKIYDLPSDFISVNVSSRLGSIIDGKVDSYDQNIIFTDAYVARLQAKIRGIFRAVTRPITVVSVLNKFGLQERLFFTILEKLVESGRLAGTISGGRQDQATYIPNIYTKSQNEWVDAFYRQNGYLEYDAMMRLGITDPKGFVKKRFGSEKLIYLSTCCTGSAIQDQIEASIEDALENESWVDIVPLLPSCFSSSDATQLVTLCLKNYRKARLCCESIVTSQDFISNFKSVFQDIVALKAETEAKNNPILFVPEGDKRGAAKVPVVAADDKKDQRRKKAASATKSGGGTQGREIKMKSTKKKTRSRDVDEDSDGENRSSTSGHRRQQELLFMTINELEEILEKQPQLRDCPEEFITDIAEQIQRPLNQQYQEMAKSIFLQTAGAATGTDRKKMHEGLKESITSLWTNVKLFEKGLKLLPESAKPNIIKHLLRSICTDIANQVILAIATEHMVSFQEDVQITHEKRVKMISRLPSEVQSTVVQFNASLNGRSLDEYFKHFDIMVNSDHLDIFLKKLDKKKERQVIFGLRQALLEQLKIETDPAMVLHLSTVVLFYVFTQSILQIPGRSVPHIVEFLTDHLSHDQHKILVNLQNLVVQQMKAGEEKDENVTSEIDELMPKVRDIALNAKKHSQQEAEDT